MILENSRDLSSLAISVLTVLNTEVHTVLLRSKENEIVQYLW